MTTSRLAVLALTLFSLGPAAAAQVPPQTDLRIYDIVAAASPERVESDIRALAGFGTRNTFSDTLSATRGIGAARRWIKDEFDRIAAACGGCYEVVYQRDQVPFLQDTWVVNVLAIKRGTVSPQPLRDHVGRHRLARLGRLRRRVGRPRSERQRVGHGGRDRGGASAADYDFGNSLVLAGLSGEEQGLWGGRHMARVAQEEGWEIVGVLNNDMIGNIEAWTA